MAKIPSIPRLHNEVERRIHTALEAARDEPREPWKAVRLSGIGKCQRELWAARHGIEDERPPGGRTLMTFRLGDKVEDAVIEWLRAAGYAVRDRGPDGEQWRVEMEGGIGVGHLDGIIGWGHPAKGDWRLLEAKSAKASRFEALEEARSYAAWNPEYADQIQGYMGASHTTLGVPALWETLVVVVCKDDSRLWSEMIRFDPDRYAQLVAKAQLVMESDSIVERDPRANGQYSKYCKWCGRGAWCYSPLAGVEFDE